MSEDAGGSPDELGRTDLPGLPGARLRTAGPGDAASLLRLQQRLDQETSFMLLEPGERGTSTEALARHLGRVARSGNSVVIVADTGGDLAGYVELAGGSFRRNRATAHLVIGVVAQASGQGVGTDFRLADLRLADLTGADLRGADLRGADLRGADLTTSLFLTQAQLDAAEGDSGPGVPASLTRPAHWPVSGGAC